MGGEYRDSGVAYFNNPLFHTLQSVENQGVAKDKSDIQIRDGVDNKKCICMLRCIRKPYPHAALHRIQTQLSSRCTALHRKLYVLKISTNIRKKSAL